jgi:hypothetical protein
VGDPVAALTPFVTQVETDVGATSPPPEEERTMATTPIYHLVLGQGFTEAWYQLSQDERDALWAKVEEAEQRAGSRWVILCDSRWADESVFDWGVLEYPDMEAYRTKVAKLEKLSWWRYWTSSRTILGTRMADLTP